MVKLASTEQICQLLDEGMVARGNEVWKVLSSHWMPKPQSEAAQVLMRLQLDQLGPDSLDEVVKIIGSWDASTQEAAHQQAEIALSCYASNQLKRCPTASSEDAWSGRVDHRMVPAPWEWFVWKIWPWSQVSRMPSSRSRLFRAADGREMWQLLLKTNKKDGWQSLYLRQATRTDKEHRVAFELLHCQGSDSHVQTKGASHNFPSCISGQ